jgi:hypothetical protein
VTPDVPDDGHEVLAHGSEKPPRRLPRVVLTVGAGCVLAGFAAGVLVSEEARDGILSLPGRGAATTPVNAAHPIPVTAGAVTPAAPVVPGRFGLSIFNWGHRELTAEIVSLPGWLSPLSDRTATRIAPRSWGLLRFSAPVEDCRVSPTHVRVAVVEVRTEAGSRSYLVPLADPADTVLRAHHAQVCGARTPRPGG